MIEWKKAGIVLTITALAGIAIFFIANQTTGFFALQKQQSQSNESISSSLSVKALQQTQLSVKLLQAGIEQCPSLMVLAFEIANSGSSNAERLFVKPSENLKVIECINCNAKQLSPSEKIIVKVKACKTSSEKASIAFSSVNAVEEKAEIK